MPSFFSRISYSFGNEDFRSEQSALKVKPDDRVLCITASGDRPLHLLMDGSKEVVSIDANPIQNFLLSLKMEAMHHFDFDEYLDFLGARPSSHRKEQLKKLLKKMDGQTQSYWTKNQHLVEKGILYQGALEQMGRRIVSPLVHQLRGRKIKKLFSFDDLNEQQEFIKREWDTRSLRMIFNVFLPLISRFVLKDPWFHSHPDSYLKPSKYIYERLNACLMRHLAKQNSLFSLLFTGTVHSDAFPPYLTEEGVKKIKSNLHKLTAHNMDLIQHLELAPDSSIDAFSLSDVASYLDTMQFNRLMRAVFRTARPGARFSIREVLSQHKIPVDLQPLFIRDHHLEKEVEEQDRCFVYRFMIGSISK